MNVKKIGILVTVILSFCIIMISVGSSNSKGEHKDKGTIEVVDGSSKEDMKERYSESIGQAYETNFLKYGKVDHSSLYQSPTKELVTQEKISGSVLVYNTVQIQIDKMSYEEWALVEFVGEKNSEIQSNRLGYVLLEDIEWVQQDSTIYEELGLEGVHIGDRYEDAVSHYGEASNFIKDEYYEWYTYHPEYAVTVYYAPETFTIIRMEIDCEAIKDASSINGEVTTESKWKDWVKLCEEEGYELKDVSEDGKKEEVMEVTVNNDVKARVNRDGENVREIEIFRVNY